MILDNQQYIDMIINLTSNLGLIGTLIGQLIVFTLILLGFTLIFIRSQFKSNKKLMEQLPYLLNEMKLINKTLDRLQDKFLDKKEQLEVSLDQLYDRLDDQSNELIALEQEKDKQFLEERKYLYKSILDLLTIFIRLKEKDKWNPAYDDYIFAINRILVRFDKKEIKEYVKTNQPTSMIHEIYYLLGFEEGDLNA